MPSGGRRPGAGKPKGAFSNEAKKLGATRDLREMATMWSTEVLGTSKDPLGLLLSIAADAKQPTPIRMNPATVALPYLYPRLSAALVETAQPHSRGRP